LTPNPFQTNFATEESPAPEAYQYVGGITKTVRKNNHMNPEEKFTIRRDNETIGSWDRFEIRQFIASGALLPTDEYLEPDTNEWSPFLPPYRRRYAFFDWAGEDDTQWYYYRDGYIHGPRTSDEIDALASAGYLKEDDLVSFLRAPSWMPYGELAEGGADAVQTDDVAHWEAAKEHVLTGNWVAAAANAGLHLWGRIPKGEHPAIEDKDTEVAPPNSP
jgi:hypothetical protein